MEALHNAKQSNKGVTNERGHDLSLPRLSLEGTAVDAVMKTAGWRTESVAKRYVGPVVASGSKRSRNEHYVVYANSSASPLSGDFTRDLSACVRR